MKNFIKKNFVILLAFTLPVVLIIAVALSTYLPSIFLSTNYNFIYASCSDRTNYNSYHCNSYIQKRYSVVNNTLVVNALYPNQDSDGDKILDIDESYTARIFLHDTKNNESREITIEEAQTLSLSNLLTSPDGVTVSNYNDRNYGGDFFFIFNGSSSSYGHYLTKGNSRDKLNLINGGDQYYYQDNFQFTGWILPGRN